MSEDAATSSSYSAMRGRRGAKDLNSYSDAYTARIDEVKGNIEKIRDERESACSGADGRYAGELGRG